MTRTILHIDASARLQDSVTRSLSGQIVRRLNGNVIRRDLARPLPLLTEDWVNANFTPADQRSDAQKEALALSDELVEELVRADVAVIGLPIYNFSVPAAFKAWIDLVARAGLTFQYTENGPEGLLKGKRAIVAVASGGVPVGSEADFATAYVRHVLGFIGITDVEFIAADRMAVAPEASLKAANDRIAALAA
ncbi:FMN-dependent NADH-azoreductase [Jhaorihella thermophila]|uniref:FMN dependent NADH:quinone oxidoreductase n=1 Tax=Jhaorihella thermophila TaxID=488547 RepID=A0A1H5XC75_9RHOB|nr:NAD(P)H-dependent oxidoreductase [Jhaorihella thermophila]SEG09329.1 FMN-dependent NADH-azoreductase [Jhaorihella thermophila]